MIVPNHNVAGSTPNVTSSPPSGSEHTHFNTPSTNVTVMSPDAVVNGGRVCMPIPKLSLRGSQSVPRANGSVAQLNHNLAVTSSHDAAILSPTANEFTPVVTGTSVTPGSGGPHHSQALATRIPSFGAVGQAIPGPTVINNVVGHMATTLDARITVSLGCFSTEEKISRIFEICDTTVLSPAVVANAFPVVKYSSLDQIDSSDMHKGVHRVLFNNIRDARLAFIEAFYNAFSSAQLTFLPSKAFAAARGEDIALISNYAAQVIVTVVTRANHEITMGELFGLLQDFGEVYAMASMETGALDAMTFRVEFCDVRHAHAAVSVSLQNFAEASIRFAAYRPDVQVGVPDAPSGTTHPLHNAVSASVERPSLTGRSTLPHDRLAEVEAMLARLMSEAAPARGLGRPGHNQVDVRRIQEGSDVRTTIMLRNIPNKVTQADLKDYLDETSLGAYDFMYLRIDFANNCNVGYAFINFVDPLAIIPFARRRAGAKWNIHDSNKIAEISYATIQGRDCLVQKFRNSSVMLEHPSYRPKLYFAGPNPHAGQEEPFPGPDNFSKMRRSIENAEHIGLYYPRRGKRTLTAIRARNEAMPSTQALTAYNPHHVLNGHMVNIYDPRDPFAGSSGCTTAATIGLFAPREGQQHREEQRRRRSQFDRGTPGAEYEAQMRLARAFGSNNF